MGMDLARKTYNQARDDYQTTKQLAPIQRFVEPQRSQGHPENRLSEDSQRHHIDRALSNDEEPNGVPQSSTDGRHNQEQ